MKWIIFALIGVALLVFAGIQLWFYWINKQN